MRPLNVGDCARATPPPLRASAAGSFLRNKLLWSRSVAFAIDSDRRLVLGAKTAGCIFSGDEHRLGCLFMGEWLRGNATACTEEGSERTQSSRRLSWMVPAGPTGIHVLALGSRVFLRPFTSHTYLVEKEKKKARPVFAPLTFRTQIPPATLYIQGWK